MTHSSDQSAHTFDRAIESQIRRDEASQRAKDRPHLLHLNNQEERLDGFPGNFRKGLIHDPDTGFLKDDRDYQAYRQAILSGLPEAVDAVRTPNVPNRRRWESPSAGFVFDLEGPDAQAITMPPAPALGSDELNAELAEVYAMAALRDTEFSAFATDTDVQSWIGRLNAFPWFCEPPERRCERTYTLDEVFGSEAGLRLGRKRAQITPQNLFRGVTTGDDKGPYISQFLLVGNPSRGADSLDKPNPDDPNSKLQEFAETDGKIAYGAQLIDQRVRVATANNGNQSGDFMTDFDVWLRVQNGEGVNQDYKFDYNLKGDLRPTYRFISTPRDLATYVHFDQLYQAYLNACIIMLEKRADVDPGIRRFNDGINQQGFAQFGGPHILSLVTEVASRALKAVRFQKFNIHNRTRPEALGGLMELLRRGKADSRLEAMRSTWTTLQDQDILRHDNHLLPMAFPEGSPMHPSYGAGHATVAGACVTILKAFFDHRAVIFPGNCAYEANPDNEGRSLRRVHYSPDLTVEGELNKLASNISIGRNMAGVHYYSDYIESLRLGELVALGILEEQSLMYNPRQFPFSMTVPLFDGGTVVIGTQS